MLRRPAFHLALAASLVLLGPTLAAQTGSSAASLVKTGAAGDEERSCGPDRTGATQDPGVRPGFVASPTTPGAPSPGAPQPGAPWKPGKTPTTPGARAPGAPAPAPSTKPDSPTTPRPDDPPDDEPDRDPRREWKGDSPDDEPETTEPTLSGRGTVSVNGDFHLRYHAFDPPVLTGSPLGLGLVYRTNRQYSAQIVDEDAQGEPIRLSHWHMPVLDDVEVKFQDNVLNGTPLEVEWITGSGDVYMATSGGGGGCEPDGRQPVETWFVFPGQAFSSFRVVQDGISVVLERYRPDGQVVRYEKYQEKAGTPILTKWRPEILFDPFDNATTYSYDSENRLESIQDCRGIKIKFDWTQASTCTVTYVKVVDDQEVGSFPKLTWSFTWDQSYRLATLALPQTTYVKTGAGGPLLDVANPVTDARTYTFTYHASGPGQGLLKDVSDSRVASQGSQVILTNTYVSVGNRVRVKDQADRYGRAHSFSYTDGTPFKTTYQYDDEAGKTTTYVFELDADGYPTKITVTPGSKPRQANGDTPEPASLTWQYTYDTCSCGLPTKIIWPSGMTVDMTYKTLGRMTSWTGPSPTGSGTVTYQWSWLGLDKQSAPNLYTPPLPGATITYSYGTWTPRSSSLWGYKPTMYLWTTSQITVEGGPNHSVAWQVDLDGYGRASMVTDPGGRQYSHAYNGPGTANLLLHSITRAAINEDMANKFEVVFDDLGRASRIARGIAGNKTEYTFQVGPFGRPRQIQVAPSAGQTYTTKLDYDRFENLAVIRTSNLDENGQGPKYDDGSGSPRTWIRNERHYFHERLEELWVDRRPLPDARDLANPASGSNPWMARYQFSYKLNGDLAQVTMPNGAVRRYEIDGYGTLYRVIDDVGGLNVERGRWYFDSDLVVSQRKRMLTGGASPTFGVTQFTRNHGGQGYLHKVTDPTGVIAELAFNSLGQVSNRKIRGSSSGNPVRLETSYVLDEIGRPRKVEEHLVGTTDKATTTIRWNVRSQVEEITDNVGRKRFRVYDGYGRLVKARDNLSSTPAESNEVELQYQQGRDFVEKSIARIFHESDDGSPPAGTRKDYHTVYTRDFLGRVTKVEQKGLSGGQTPLASTYGWNSLDMMVFFQDPRQQGSSNKYSRSVFDAQGRWVEFVKRIGAGGSDRIRLTGTYTDNASTTAVTLLDGRGFQTKHEYDAGYRLRDVYRPGSVSGQRPHHVTLTYDAGSRIEQIEDGNGNVIDQTFDNAGRLLTRTATALGPDVSALSDKESYAWDDIGRLRDQSTWWAGGTLLVGGSTLSRDGLGRITQESFVYSGVDLTNPVNIQSGYQVPNNPAGDPTFRRSLTYSSGANVRSVPDVVGRLKERYFTPAGGTEALLGRYRFAGGITLHREQFYAGTSNKMVTDLSFDGYHRLTALDHKLNGGSSTHLEQYVWDAASNLLKRKYPKQDGSAGDAYQYDDYDRLVGAKMGVPAGEIDNSYGNINTWAKEVVYALDPGQNRSSVTTTLAQQTPVQEDYTTEADSPRYETVSSIPSPLEYDGEGNLIWDGTYMLIYDFRNRLSEVYQCSGGMMASSSSGGGGERQQLSKVSITDLKKARKEILGNAENGDLWKLLKENPEDAKATVKVSGSGGGGGGPRWPAVSFECTLELVSLYVYDTHNRRIGRQVSLPELTVDQRFSYDGWREVEQLVPTDVGGSMQAVAEKVFAWGRELDELLAYQRKESGSWVSYYPVQDRRESVVKLLDAQGNVVENVEYDPYGKATVYVGGTPQASSSVENPYLYQGRRVDPETGFVYLRNRYLHTKFGRFLSVDPIGSWSDAYNLGNGYGFVGERPTSRVDPIGLYTVVFVINGAGRNAAWTFVSQDPEGGVIVEIDIGKDGEPEPPGPEDITHVHPEEPKPPEGSRMTLHFAVSGHGRRRNAPEPPPFIEGGRATITEIERYLTRLILSGKFKDEKPDGFIFMCHAGHKSWSKSFTNPARVLNGGFLAGLISTVTGNVIVNNDGYWMEDPENDEIVEVDKDGNVTDSDIKKGKDGFLDWNNIFGN